MGPSAEGRTCWWTPRRRRACGQDPRVRRAGRAHGPALCPVLFRITADLVDKFCPAEGAAGPGGGTLVGPGAHVRSWLPEKSLVASLRSTPCLTDRTSRLCQAGSRTWTSQDPPGWMPRAARAARACCAVCVRACVCVRTHAHACSPGEETTAADLAQGCPCCPLDRLQSGWLLQ